jgi:exonuclease I
MKTNKICCYDFETGGKNPNTCQPIQLSAVMIDAVKLEVIPNSLFDTYIKAVEDPTECEKAGIQLVQDEALEVNKITWEQIRGGLSLEQAWKNFGAYTLAYANSKRNWDQPYSSGFNVIKFDDIITTRMCKLYGPWDEKDDRQKIFHPSVVRDVYSDMDRWTEGQNFKSIGMDATRDWMGIDKKDAHNSKKDVLDTAYILIKFMKLYRYMFSKVKFEDSFDVENALIAEMMK